MSAQPRVRAARSDTRQIAYWTYIAAATPAARDFGQFAGTLEALVLLPSKFTADGIHGTVTTRPPTCTYVNKTCYGEVQPVPRQRYL